MLRLNLGSGKSEISGYINLDGLKGDSIFPLSYPDDSIQEIRASHVIEHVSHRQVLSVLKDWFRALAPGGIIKIAVPDFEKIATQYLAGKDINVQGYVSGGQEDEYDYHKTVFDKESLIDVLTEAGFTDFTDWTSDYPDCSANPISLLIQAKKPLETAKTSISFDFPAKIQACMSVPRLGFMDNFFCVTEALLPLRIPVRKQTGVFWGQCLTKAIQDCLNDEPDYVLTIDYDTIFTKEDVVNLVNTMNRNPQVDALAALQVGRGMGPLFRMNEDQVEFEKNVDGVKALIPIEMLEQDILPVKTMHFGLTLIRSSSLKKLKKPWFQAVPDRNGEWNEGKLDDDIYFWHNWKKCGLTAAIAPRVPVGHSELCILYPDHEMNTIYQQPRDYWKNGKPKNVWK